MMRSDYSDMSSDPLSVSDHWTRAVEEFLPAIWQEVVSLYHRKQVHDDFVQLLESRSEPNQDQTLGLAFHSMYVDAASFAVRRQADKRKDVVSLRRLLGLLEKYADEFTRDRFIRRWAPDQTIDAFGLREANGVFDQFTATDGDRAVSKRRIQADREMLEARTSPIHRYVDTYLAHDGVEKSPIPTYGELDEAIDCIGEMLKRYYLLLAQTTIVELTPVTQKDWLAEFR